MVGLLLSTPILFLVLRAIASPEACPDGVCKAPEDLGIQQEEDASMLQHRKKRTTFGTTCEISEHWITINNHKYSRMKADHADLGDIGQTDGIWTLHRPVKINFHRKAPAEWLDGTVESLPPVRITSEQAGQLAANLTGGGLAGPGKIAAAAGINQNDSHTASLELVGLTISDTYPIKHSFATDQGFYDDYQDMFSGAKKPRIVTTVWILKEQLAENTGHECIGGHLTVTYNVAGQYNVGGGIAGDKCTQSTWSYTPGAIMAYEAAYAEYEWPADVPPSGRVKNIVTDSLYTR